MHTSIRPSLLIATAVAALGLGMVTLPASRAVAAEPVPEWDGLLRVPDKGADHLYLLRDADFSTYTHVRVAPVQIAFDPDWRRNSRERNPQRFMSDKDMEQLRSNLAREFHTILEQRMMKEGYTVTDKDGDHVLLMSPQIMNLYVTAPSKPTSGRSRRYIANTGHMTFVLQLHDSVTGQLLGRVVDTQSGRRDGRFVLASPATNLADAQAAINHWATVTLTALNYAKQSSPGTAVAEKKGAKTEAPR